MSAGLDPRPSDLSNYERLIIELKPLLKIALQKSFRIYCLQLSHAEIEDHTQEIILRLIENDYRRLRTFDQKSSLRTWSWIVVKHYLINHFRGMRRTESLSDVSPDSVIIKPLQEDTIISMEKSKKLSSILTKLNDTEMLLFELLMIDMGSEQIALQMNRV